MFQSEGTFLDPHYCDQFVETDHLFATMNAVYLHPPLEYGLVNRGDFGGWGGDLAQLYGDWQDAGKPPAYEFAYSRVLGNIGGFKLLDAIEDADGFNMAMTLLSNPSLTIYEVAAEYYTPAGPYRGRFSTFYYTRFGNQVRARTMAHEMLTGPGHISPTEEEGVALIVLRTAIIQDANGRLPLPWLQMPEDLPFAELSPFYSGFADALNELARDTGRSCTLTCPVRT